MTISKTFPPRYTFIKNCFLASCQVARIQAYGGYTIKDVRATKPSPLTGTPMTISRTYRNVSRVSRAGWKGSVGFCWAGKSPVVSKTTDSRSEGASLRQRALSNLGSGKLNLGESLPELNKTASLVSARINRITDIAQRTVMGDIPGVEESIQNRLTRRQKRILNGPKSLRLSILFNEFSYGWVPLVNDIYGAIELYHSEIKTSGDAVRASTGTSSRPVVSGPYLDSPQDLGAIARRATSRGVVRNPMVASLNSLGLLNPALIVWNRMPYSFVVDWVLPVSHVLTALTSNLGLSGVYAVSITERRVVTEYSTPQLWDSVSQVIERSVSSSNAFSNVSFVDASAPAISKVANAAALLRAAIR